jgi:5-formyltetrahydrofolate cyclo-ligase
MGAGVYDRYLQQCPQAFRLGVAYAAQMVEQVAAEPWDVRMDAVVTEQGMCPCESGSGQKRKDEEQPE